MKLFHKLEEAISISSTDSEFAVFSKEYELGGKRHFLVGSREEFWETYKNQSSKKHYEVILPGTPCKLFFDLEYDASLNTSTDGEQMTQALISVVKENISKKFGITITNSDLCILDSSDKKKFSKHIIFSSCIFKDCETCGSYVEDIISNLDLNQRKQLTVIIKGGREVLFIDQAVYTRNRNFRLFLSSKFGKNIPLIVSDIGHVENKHFNIPSEQTTFFQSLITNIPKGSTLVTYCRDQTLKTRVINSPIISGSQSIDHSPYPEFDRFLISLIKPGHIKKVIFHDNVRTNMPVIIYNVSGYNYCQNIQRCHKNNNVFFIANIYKRQIIQRCHDYECSTFSSVPIPLTDL